MTSTNKIESNQRNAQLSTGPRTPEGKARVAGNPVTHGLRGRHTVLITENPHEFAQLCDDFFAEWQPLNHTEADLVEQLCVTKWKLARMERVESQACMLSALVHLALRPELGHATPNLDAKSEKAAAASLNRTSQHIARLERGHDRQREERIVGRHRPQTHARRAQGSGRCSPQERDPDDDIGEPLHSRRSYVLCSAA